MSYQRVIPRDLFNEANLLKCLGKVYLNLENLNIQDVELIHDGGRFNIEQDECSGVIYATNIYLSVRETTYHFIRPLNSRGEWPLYMVDNSNEIDVFNPDGSFTRELISVLKGE
jgi:hypothetical protein